MDNAKILHLTIEKKWFEMIASGEKKEEYRALSQYWIKRLLEHSNIKSSDNIHEFLNENNNKDFCFKRFDYVHFFNGGYFSEKLPNFMVKLESISIGFPNPQWIYEPSMKCLILKLGEIVK